MADDTRGENAAGARAGPRDAQAGPRLGARPGAVAVALGLMLAGLAAEADARQPGHEYYTVFEFEVRSVRYVHYIGQRAFRPPKPGPVQLTDGARASARAAISYSARKHKIPGLTRKEIHVTGIQHFRRNEQMAAYYRAVEERGATPWMFSFKKPEPTPKPQLSVAGPARIAADTRKAVFRVLGGATLGRADELRWSFAHKTRFDKWETHPVKIVRGVRPFEVIRLGPSPTLSEWLALAARQGRHAGGVRRLDMRVTVAAFRGFTTRVAESRPFHFAVAAGEPGGRYAVRIAWAATPLRARVVVTDRRTGKPAKGRQVKFVLRPHAHGGPRSVPYGHVLKQWVNVPWGSDILLSSFRREEGRRVLNVPTEVPVTLLDASGREASDVTTNDDGEADFPLFALIDRTRHYSSRDRMVYTGAGQAPIRVDLAPAELAHVLAQGKTVRVEGEALVYDGTQVAAREQHGFELDHLARIVNVTWSGTGQKRQWDKGVRVIRHGGRRDLVTEGDARDPNSDKTKLTYRDRIALDKQDQAVIRWITGQTLSAALKPNWDPAELHVGLADLGTWRTLAESVGHPVLGFTLGAAGLAVCWLSTPAGVAGLAAAAYCYVDMTWLSPFLIHARSTIAIDAARVATVYTVRGHATVLRPGERHRVEVPEGRKVTVDRRGVGRAAPFGPRELAGVWQSLLRAPRPVPAGQEPFDLGAHVEPLVDRFLIDRARDVALRLHKPRRRELVFRFDKPWEGNVSSYVTVFSDDDGHRMYYRAAHLARVPGRKSQPTHQFTCLAMSLDGVRWVRPRIARVAFQGSRDNNIVWDGERWRKLGSFSFAPVKDTHPRCPPAERYKALAVGHTPPGLVDGWPGALYALTSPDGRQWSPLRDSPIYTRGSFDGANVAFWDPAIARYRLYFGEYRKADRDFGTLWKPGVSVDRKAGTRDLMTAASADFRRWDDARWLSFPGAPFQHIQAGRILPYPGAKGLYLGVATRVVGPPATRPVSDTLLMTSRDGVTWHRWPDPLFPRGGASAHYLNVPAHGLLPTWDEEGALLDEWSFYVGEGYLTPGNGLRRYSVPRHRLVGFQAGATEGELVTKPFTFAGDRLLLNYDASGGGALRVELQNADGTPLPGRALRDARTLVGNALAGPALWRDGAAVGRLRTAPIRVRVLLRNARLYAFRFGK